MALTAQLLRYSPLPFNRRISNPPSSIAFPFSSSRPPSQNPSHHFVFPITLPKSNIIDTLRRAFAGDDNGNGVGNGGGGGGGGKGDSKGENEEDDGEEEFMRAIGVLGRILSGWVLRWVITGDPAFALGIVMKDMLVWRMLIVVNLGVILYGMGMGKGMGEAIAEGAIMILMAVTSLEFPLGVLFVALGYYAGIGALVCISFYFVIVFAARYFCMG